MIQCPACLNHTADLYDVVDLNKSCEDLRHGSMVLPLRGEAVYYHRCNTCLHLFTIHFNDWKREYFTKIIYDNDEYILVDPDSMTRWQQQLSFVKQVIKPVHTVLDLGCGKERLLVQALRKEGYTAAGFDKYYPEANQDEDRQGRVDVVVSFEVAEHSSVHEFISSIDQNLKSNGIVLFSTLLQPEPLVNKCKWWYCGPRNGHITLYSNLSLQTAFDRYGYRVMSFSSGQHLAWRGPDNLSQEWRLELGIKD